MSLPSGSGAYAAIDTGTTLIGGPAQYVAAIFAQIPGSQAGTGNFESYYTYRACLHLSGAARLELTSAYFFSATHTACDTDVNVTLSFGGTRSWTISSADFQLTRLTRTTCLGAFFELSTGSSAPAWIVGDTFLVRACFPPRLVLLQ